MLTEHLVNKITCDDRALVGRRASVVGIACNVFLAIIKAVAGVVSGSVSVVADSLNNLMDSVSSIVSLVGFKLAEKPADKQHPYGHGRSEYIAGLGVAAIIVVVGVELAKSSIECIIDPVETHYTVLTIAVLVVSVLAKLWLMRFYTLAGKRIGSKTLEAAAADSRNDALATSAVLLGVLITSVTGVSLDAWLGLGVGVLVVVSGFDLIRTTMDPLLGSEPDPELVERVRQKILSYPDVLDTHDLLIHDYGPGRRFASAHVEMSAEEDPLETHRTIDKIEHDLQASEGLMTVLHYDPVPARHKGDSDIKSQLEEALRRVDAGLTAHDLNVMDEEGKGRVLDFDCVVPEGITASDGELLVAIQREVDATMPGYECRIEFDKGYMASVEQMQ